MPASSWVIVSGGFHERGGMDRANAALARYLLESGVCVHLVGHEIDEELRVHPRARIYEVPRPRGLPAVAESLLSRRGMQVARMVTSSERDARVVVNGGNCPWPDANWAHAVHAAWPVRDEGAPWWMRQRNRRLKARARRRERTAFMRAGTVVANSHGTARALVALGVAPDRVHTIYPGTDPTWSCASAAERTRVRAELGVPVGAPVVVFVGALGSDSNKGFDVLWEAWRLLAESGSWDATLIAAGGGWQVVRLRQEVASAGLQESVQLLGHVSNIRELLAAGDLLVSPVRYEAYGLNVQEALCRGLAVMVTETAGVVERFNSDMSASLLPSGVTADVLAERLRAWRRDVDGWRARASATAARLREWTWPAMAAELVDTVDRYALRVPA